ncbi:OmpW family outer membrane porin [Pseudomonas sp. MT-1]|jgi:outer membrane protein|uniref:OmpW/AlkL family protein n=1 Tax=Stutzerimonas stutzeri TaxID=316 RepID=UPI000536078B|nr:OmpW family outer membrane protein [Stutzerimonas stutzeri]AZZ44030.1 outer membrane protein OmpW [Pseudomonadaceae bacterium SI-3]MCQ4283261.1 outer membrane beta-barrel protein [Stutzerimonas stutzeri]BAP81271.1 OmpW family outer membrane porin [Pseudomonas sp. MT-1]
MRKTLFTASVLALALAAPFAQAFEAGDIIVRAGAITVDPHEDSSSISTAVTGPLAGTKATLDSDTQLGLNFAYMVTDKVGIELLAATPFSHDVGVKGLGAPLDGKFGTIKHLPPTLSVIYYPLDKTSAFQPYAGAGVNYTWFFDDKLSSQAEGNGFNGLDLKDSWGLAAQVGMDYMLTDNIMLNAQVRYIDIDTEATSNHAALGKVKVDVDVDPFVYMVGLGYKF